MELRVTVPCSTSNLGPGFDLLGLALALHLEVRATPLPTGAEAHVWKARTGTAASWPLPDGAADDRVLRAFDAVWHAKDLAAPPHAFRAHSAIPIMRGLGSSGAAVAAGLLLANRALVVHGHTPLTPRELHPLGIAIEGHPDNVTASLFGGCTLCLPPNAHDAPRGALVFQAVSETLGFAVVWGAATTPTERAREVLPRTLAFDAAKENPRRLALLLEGLRSGDPELLALGVHDELHHTARLALIPGGAETLAAARAAGAFATAINGSGSSLLAIGPAGGMAPIAAALATELARHDTDVVAHELAVVHGAPEVQAS